MKATQLLHERGQSLWLDNITRDLLNSGTLERYSDELSVTGLTSNPTISERGPRTTRDQQNHVGRRRGLRHGIEPVRSSRHRPRSLTARLQDEESFVNSWNELMNVIAPKSSKLAKASS